jgi:hypothetical protein
MAYPVATKTKIKADKTQIRGILGEIRIGDMEKLYGEFHQVVIDGQRTNVAICELGIAIDSETGYLKTTSINDNGDIFIRLRHKDRWGLMVTSTRLLKKLVAEMFVPRELDDDCKYVHSFVDFIDGNRLNCKAENLIWVHRKGSPGLKGEENINSIYTNKQIHEVCKLIDKRTFPPNEISKMTGVDTHSINAIRRRRSWTHISSQYELPECRYSTGINAQLIQ